jgi:ABC-type nickel/cobalt efflux system permease component RcnA
MKSMYLVVIVAFLIGLFVSNWIFNHINPWIAYIAYALTIGLTINYFYKQLKSKINEKN